MSRLPSYRAIHAWLCDHPTIALLGMIALAVAAWYVTLWAGAYQRFGPIQ
jgi:hypothetical protein